MKDFLVMLGTIILGVFIAITLIVGNSSTSVKSKSESVGTKMSTDINKATTNSLNVTTP